MQIDIGSRLKHSRLNTGLSQRALAKKAGVTNGLISQIEQNRISPSIASLKKILDVLSLSLADFFTTDDGRAPDFFYERKQLPNLGSGDVAIFLVGAGIRHRAMSILHEIYPPGADTGPQMLSHAGEEGGVVTKGKIEITDLPRASNVVPSRARIGATTSGTSAARNASRSCSQRTLLIDRRSLRTT